MIGAIIKLEEILVINHVTKFHKISITTIQLMSKRAGVVSVTYRLTEGKPNSLCLGTTLLWGIIYKEFIIGPQLQDKRSNHYMLEECISTLKVFFEIPSVVNLEDKVLRVRRTDKPATICFPFGEHYTGL